MYFLFFYPDAVTSLIFLFGRLVLYKGSLVALFQYVSNGVLLLVTICVGPFFFTNTALSSWKPCTASPGPTLPSKLAGLSLTHLQGNGLNLSSCFSDPGHSACNKAKLSLYFSLCRLWHLLFLRTLSCPSLEHVQDTAVIYINTGVFGRIDSREGRWVTIKDVTWESLQVR